MLNLNRSSKSDWLSRISIWERSTGKSLCFWRWGSTRNQKKHKQKIIDHVLGLAMSVSEAATGLLYCAHGRGKFSLLSSKGVKAQKKEMVNVISTKTVGLLRHLLQEKTRLNGDIKRYQAELLALDNKLDYFVTLPLSKGATLKGFIFLGFDTKKAMDTQELEFLDVFAVHASAALISCRGLERDVMLPKKTKK